MADVGAGGQATQTLDRLEHAPNCPRQARQTPRQHEPTTTDTVRARAASALLLSAEFMEVFGIVTAVGDAKEFVDEFDHCSA